MSSNLPISQNHSPKLLKIQNSIPIRITLGEHHVNLNIGQNLLVSHPSELHLGQLAISILIKQVPGFFNLHVPVNITPSVHILELAEQMVALHIQDKVCLGHHTSRVSNRLKVSKIFILHLNTIIITQQQIFIDGDFAIITDICFVKYFTKSCNYNM